MLDRVLVPNRRNPPPVCAVSGRTRCRAVPCGAEYPVGTRPAPLVPGRCRARRPLPVARSGPTVRPAPRRRPRSRCPAPPCGPFRAPSDGAVTGAGSGPGPPRPGRWRPGAGPPGSTPETGHRSRPPGVRGPPGAPRPPAARRGCRSVVPARPHGPPGGRSRAAAAGGGPGPRPGYGAGVAGPPPATPGGADATAVTSRDRGVVCRPPAGCPGLPSPSTSSRCRSTTPPRRASRSRCTPVRWWPRAGPGTPTCPGCCSSRADRGARPAGRSAGTAGWSARSTTTGCSCSTSAAPGGPHPPPGRRWPAGAGPRSRRSTWRTSGPTRSCGTPN